jgi:FkbM family methyltransferase
MVNSLAEKFNNSIRSADFYKGTTRWERLTQRPIKTVYSVLLRRLNRLLGDRINTLVEAKTFWDDPMKVLLLDSTSIFLWGLIEGEEVYLTKLLIERLKPGDVFIDIGAHFGYYALLASKLVGPSGQVHAFEPTPRTFKILKQNVSEKENIKINQRALWMEKGSIDLIDFGPQAGAFNTFLDQAAYPFKFISNRYYQKAMQTIKVETLTLDEYCSDMKLKPDFIKLDTEGSEYNIFLGSKKTLAHRPIISLEIWGRDAWQERYSSIFDLLKEYSYKPYWLRDGQLKPYNYEKDFFFTNVIFYSTDKS